MLVAFGVDLDRCRHVVCEDNPSLVAFEWTPSDEDCLPGGLEVLLATVLLTSLQSVLVGELTELASVLVVLFVAGVDDVSSLDREVVVLVADEVLVGRTLEHHVE